MSGLSLRELHAAIGGQLALATLPPLGGCSVPLGRIVTALDQITPGDVYWDVENRRASRDWNAEEAFFRGAQGVICSGPRPEPWAGRFTLEVADPAAALEQLVAQLRTNYRGRLIAVAGEVGKSTTLHLIQSAVGRGEAIGIEAPVVRDAAPSATWPARLAQLVSTLARQTPYALVEVSSDEQGSWCDRVARLVPDVVALTSLPHESHNRNLYQEMTDGRLDRLARVTRALDELPTDRFVVLPGDDPELCAVADCTAARVWTVGRGSQCDLMASDIQCRDGWLSCEVAGQRVAAPLWGRHQIGALLTAFAVGRIVGRPTEQVVESLRASQPLPQRCEVIRTPRYTVINDTGDGRPATVGPALDLLRDVDAPGRRIVVCGDLADLADVEPTASRQIGEAVVTRCGADWLVTWGKHSGQLTHAARDAGLPAGRAVCCQNARDGQTRLASLLREGDVVLVKGQPLAAMRELVAQLVASATSQNHWKAPSSA